MAVTLRQSVDIRDPVDPEAEEESGFLRSTAASERGDEQTHPTTRVPQIYSGSPAGDLCPQRDLWWHFPAL